MKGSSHAVRHTVREKATHIALREMKVTHGEVRTLDEDGEIAPGPPRQVLDLERSKFSATTAAAPGTVSRARPLGRPNDREGTVKA